MLKYLYLTLSISILMDSALGGKNETNNLTLRFSLSNI